MKNHSYGLSAEGFFMSNFLFRLKNIKRKPLFYTNISLPEQKITPQKKLKQIYEQIEHLDWDFLGTVVSARSSSHTSHTNKSLNARTY